MKFQQFILISDIHDILDHVLALDTYVEELGSNPIIIDAGDIAHGTPEHVNDIVSRLHKPLSDNGSNIYAIAGNHDDPVTFDEAIEKINHAHNVSRRIEYFGSDDSQEFAILGCDGTVKKNPDASTSPNPRWEHETLEEFQNYADTLKRDGFEQKNAIYLTHQGVKGYCDGATGKNTPNREALKIKNAEREKQGLPPLPRPKFGYHLGNGLIRDFFEESSFNPGLVINGHVHEDDQFDLRIREYGTNKSVYKHYNIDGMDDGVYDVKGIHIEKTDLDMVVTYDTSQYDITAFINPGSLGKRGVFGDLTITDEGDMRTLHYKMLNCVELEEEYNILI